ncbi:MAG: hypothetical protein HY043_20545, partial [Verrucomicrobia bacterium]|nr:hypothetical protein [Verrucomicrobiota bacterium]
APSDAELEARFQNLYDVEKKSDVTLWHPLQLCVAGEPTKFSAELGVNIPVTSVEQRQQLLQAWHARRWLVTMMSTAGHSQDTAINLVDIALRLEREGLAANTAFYLIQNKYDNNDNNRPSQLPYGKGELGHRNKLARLLCAVAPGARAYSLQNWTPFGFKAGGLTGMDLAYEETMKLSTILVLDRNATVNDLDNLMIDLARALTDPGVVIIIPGRGTTNTLTPLGQASQLVEEGHRSFAKGLMAWMGGTGSEAIGTGWGNILAVFYGRVQRAMVDTNTPKRPLTSRMRRGSSFGVRLEGLIGFSPHAVGISEDTWSVSQTAHNAIALGHRVKFLLSHTMWHKIRETWSHTEWLSAFPRWSGGFMQMMHDPVMQQINDFGPLSIFAKEVRANSGRYFLTAIFALASILLMPFAIILDIAPFVQILIVLWNFGFIMNQVLTMHGLQTYLEGSGFRRVPALAGAVGAGLLCLALKNLQPLAPGLIILGLLLGGFIVGFSRWFYCRLRDVILFGPQLILHALGQLMRQSLEFVASGASPDDAKGVNMAFRTWSGPREDRPHEKFPSIFNFRTVVWLVGGTSLAVHVVALGSLDMFNVLLLLPSLLFSVSTFLGPFLTKPKAGSSLGWRVVFPKGLAWGSCFLIYTLVSWLVAQGGSLKAIGVTLLSALFGFLLTRALRYLGFQGKLQRLKRALERRLTVAGVAKTETESLAKLFIEQNASAVTKMQMALIQAATPSADADSILKFAEEKIRPVLRAPMTDLTEGRFANSRFASEFSASFVLALFTLGMFYVVPVPGLFVFAAHNYHISLGIGTVLRIVGWIIGLAIVSLWVGRLVEWLEGTGLNGGLRRRTESAYGNFQKLWQDSRKLTPQEISSVYALFTDVQTYVDQRSYGYARRTLKQIEVVLAAAGSR